MSLLFDQERRLPPDPARLPHDPARPSHVSTRLPSDPLRPPVDSVLSGTVPGGGSVTVQPQSSLRTLLQENRAPTVAVAADFRPQTVVTASASWAATAPPAFVSSASQFGSVAVPHMLDGSMTMESRPLVPEAVLLPAPLTEEPGRPVPVIAESQVARLLWTCLA